MQLINPILRGWVNYFAVGHSSECFSFIKDWVEKKVRRHMLRARKRKGFGWTRWSRQWLYETLRLFNDYGVRRPLSPRQDRSDKPWGEANRRAQCGKSACCVSPLSLRAKFRFPATETLVRRDAVRLRDY